MVGLTVMNATRMSTTATYDYCFENTRRSHVISLDKNTTTGSQIQHYLVVTQAQVSPNARPGTSSWRSM